MTASATSAAASASAERRGEPGVGADRRELDQHLPRRARRQRRAQPRARRRGRRPASGISSKLSTTSPSSPRSRASSASAASGDATPAQATTRVRGAGSEAQRDAGDDAERPLRPDQQLLDVVAAGVLDQRRQLVEHRARRQHRLEPGDARAHRAVAQHLDAAGVGRDEPADRRRPLRREVEREDHARRGARAAWTSARIAPAPTVIVSPARSTAPIAVHPRERDDDRLPRRVGRRAADEPGIAALRHERRPGRAAAARTMAATCCGRSAARRSSPPRRAPARASRRGAARAPRDRRSSRRRRRRGSQRGRLSSSARIDATA